MHFWTYISHHLSMHFWMWVDRCTFGPQCFKIHRCTFEKKIIDALLRGKSSMHLEAPGTLMNQASLGNVCHGTLRPGSGFITGFGGADRRSLNLFALMKHVFARTFINVSGGSRYIELAGYDRVMLMSYIPQNISININL